MHRADHAGAGQESAENPKQEGGENQPHVPDLHHAALLLHHHRMEKRRAGEPGKNGSVLHRVPSPISAPAEHRVGPVRAQKNSAGQERPSHHRPAAGDVNPFLAGILHNQRRQREGKRHGNADVAEIQHGRMDHHLRILQQRIEPVAVRRNGARHQGKGVGGKVHQQQEENLNRRNNDGSVRHQAGVHLVAKTQNQPVAGQQPAPEQQGAFLARPERGEFVLHGEIAIAVMKDVSQREVIAERRKHQGKGSGGDRHENGNSGAAGSFAESFIATKDSDNSGGKGIDAQGQRQQQTIASDLGHENGTANRCRNSCIVSESAS